MPERATERTGTRLQRYLITGLITVIPIWITWVAFQFVGKRLVEMGDPWVERMIHTMTPVAPVIAELFSLGWFKPALAMLVTLSGLCLLGWLVTLVVGKRIIAYFDRLIARIPLVHQVYGAVKTLLDALQTKPDGTQRVVLISFPSDAMKTIGLVTRVMTDTSGRELAAVYVPTTPNPTSGYLEIVPIEDLVPLDWSMDEAMSFIISGGAVAPATINYDKPND